MATRPNRSEAGLLVCLADPLSDSRAWTERCVEPSCEPSGHVDDLPQEGPGAVSSKRIPRFSYMGMRRDEPTDSPVRPDETSTPKKTPVMGRSSEEEVK